jgi:hypothetical protein
MADSLLAQSAIDRLQSAAYELVLDGESYRQRQKPTVTAAAGPLDGPAQPGDHPAADVDTPMKWSHATDARGGPIELAHDTAETVAAGTQLRWQ